MKLLLGIASLLASAVYCTGLEAKGEQDCPLGNCPQPRPRPPITVYCTETVTTTQLFTTCVVRYSTRTVDQVVTVTTCPIPMPTERRVACSSPTRQPVQDDDTDTDPDTGTGTDTDTMITNETNDSDEGKERGKKAVSEEVGEEGEEQRPGWIRICVRRRFGRCVQWRWIRRQRERR